MFHIKSSFLYEIGLFVRNSLDEGCKTHRAISGH